MLITWGLYLTYVAEVGTVLANWNGEGQRMETRLLGKYLYVYRYHQHEELAVKLFRKWGWVTWDVSHEVVGGKICGHEILSWMLFGRREVGWSGSGDEGKEENFFFLGPDTVVLRRNHSYILRKIQERIFLSKKVSFQERGWVYTGFCWLTRESTVEGFQELKTVEITQEKAIPRTTGELLSEAKGLMGEFWTFGDWHKLYHWFC